MRLLHTSDWHLGRETYKVPRRPDHETVLDEIVEAARRFRPDLIVHSGDLFDGIRPSYDDILLGFDVLERLADVAPVVVVCGNHDSPALFRVFARLLGDGARIRFVDVARTPENGGILEFPAGDERIRLSPVPFIHANRLVPGFEDPALRTAIYADKVAAIEARLARGLLDGFRPDRDVAVFAAHLYVGGARYGRSERTLHVSDAYASRVEAVPAVSYAALGHIHKPQSLTGAVAGRYAGSPLALDFGEEGETKDVVLVDARPGRPADVEVEHVSGGRPLRSIDGTIDEVLALGSPEQTLLRLVLRSDDPVPDAGDRIRSAFPNATILEIVEIIGSRRADVVAADPARDAAEAPIEELFAEYVGGVGTRIARADSVISTFRQLLAAVSDEVEPVLEGEDALIGEVPMT
jgi:exonuclease SbcD